MKQRLLFWILSCCVLALFVSANQPQLEETTVPDVDYGGGEIVTVEDAIASGQIPDDMYGNPELYQNAEAYALIDPDKFDTAVYFQATDCFGCALETGGQDLSFSPQGITHPNGDKISLPGDPPYPLGSKFISTEEGFVLQFDKKLIGQEYFENDAQFNFNVPEFDSVTVDTEGSTVRLNDGATINGKLEVRLGSVIIPAQTSGGEVFINGHEIITADTAVIVEMSKPPYFDVESRVAVDRMKVFNFEDRELRVYLGKVPSNAFGYNYVGFQEKEFVASSDQLVIHARPGNPYLPMEEDGVVRFAFSDASLRLVNYGDGDAVVEVGVDQTNEFSTFTLQNGKENIYYQVGTQDRPGTKDHYTTSGEDGATTPMKLTMHAFRNGVEEPLFDGGASEILFTEDTVTVVDSTNHEFTQPEELPDSGIELKTRPIDQTRLSGVDVKWSQETTEDEAWELFYTINKDMSLETRKSFNGVVVLSADTYAQRVNDMELMFQIAPNEEAFELTKTIRDAADKLGTEPGTPGDAARAPYYIRGGTLYLKEGNYDENTLDSARRALEKMYVGGSSHAADIKQRYDSRK